MSRNHISSIVSLHLLLFYFIFLRKGVNVNKNTYRRGVCDYISQMEKKSAHSLVPDGLNLTDKNFHVIDDVI